MEFHPERHLPAEALAAADVAALVADKRHWIDTLPTPALAKRRCQAIRSANAQLARRAAAARAAFEARLAPLADAVHAREVLGSREYPWCFFPEKSLKTFLLLETA